MQKNESKTMFIRVLVTPNAKEAKVTKISNTDYEVKVDERASGISKLNSIDRFPNGNTQ